MSLFEGLKEAAGGALSNLERSAQALRDAPAAMQRAVLNNPRVIAITDSIISSAEQWMRSAKKEAQWYQRAIAQEWVVAGTVFRTAENVGRWVEVARWSSTIVDEVAHVAERVGRVSQKVGDGVIGTFTGAAHLVEGTGEAIGTSIARMQTEWAWAQYERLVEATSSGIEMGVHWYAAAVEWTSRMNEYTADQWSDGLASGAGMIVGGVLPIGGVSRLWQVEKLSGVKGFLNTEVNVGKAVKAVGEKMAAATVNVLGGDASALKTQERLIAEAQQILAQQERALVQARERMQEAQERLRQAAEHQIETVREMNILKDALAKDPTNTVLEAAVKEAEKAAGQAGRAVRSAEQALRSSEGVVAHAGEAVWHAARGVHLAETAGAHHTGGQPTEEQVDANTPDAANDATFPESARQSIPVQDAANDAIGIQATGTHGAPSHGPTLRAGPGLGESVIFERNGEVLTGNISDLMPDGRPVVSWRGVDPVTGKEGTFSKPMNPKDVHSANDPDFRLPDDPPARTAESLSSKPTVKLPDGTELRPLGGEGWVHSWHAPDGKFFRHVYDDGLPPELQTRYTRELRAQEKVATVDAPRSPAQLTRSLENCELGSSMTLVTENGSRHTFQRISDTQFRLTHSTSTTAEKIIGRDGHLTITQDGKAHFDNGWLTTSRVRRTEVGADRWELADRMARAEAGSDVLRREVLENAAITDPAERARKANEIVEKLKLWTLTPDQLAVVNHVHENISRGVYANGIWDLRAMTRAMDEAGISRPQQRALIEHGICGKAPAPSIESIRSAQNTIESLRRDIELSRSLNQETLDSLVDALHTLILQPNWPIKPQQIFSGDFSQDVYQAWQRAQELANSGVSVPQLQTIRTSIRETIKRLDELNKGIRTILERIGFPKDLGSYYTWKTSQLDQDFETLRAHIQNRRNIAAELAWSTQEALDKTLTSRTVVDNRLQETLNTLEGLRNAPEHTSYRHAAANAEATSAARESQLAARTPETVANEIKAAPVKSLSDVEKLIESMAHFPGLDNNASATLKQILDTAKQAESSGVWVLMDEISAASKKLIPKMSEPAKSVFSWALSRINAALDDM